MNCELCGAKLHYEIYGESERTLLLLHGWGGKCESWLPVIRDFQADYRLIVVDFPGHGQSPEPPEPWSVTEYMEQIHALLQYLKAPRVDIMAHSFGGRVSLLLASAYPETIGKMVLTGCAGLLPQKSGKGKMRSRWYRLLRFLCTNRVIRKIMGEEYVERTRERLIQKYGSRDYRVLSPSMRQTFNRVVQQDLYPCLAKIKASTLLIWGENDTETPLWMGQTMEKQIRDAGLVVLKDCGHFAYLDRYGDFQVIVRKFLT